jgi:hypothetical protein
VLSLERLSSQGIQLVWKLMARHAHAYPLGHEDRILVLNEEMVTTFPLDTKEHKVPTSAFNGYTRGSLTEPLHRGKQHRIDIHG